VTGNNALQGCIVGASGGQQFNSLSAPGQFKEMELFRSTIRLDCLLVLMKEAKMCKEESKQARPTYASCDLKPKAGQNHTT
jgi:hypothetical protein